MLHLSLVLLTAVYASFSSGGTLISTGFDKVSLEIDIISRDIHVWIKNSNFDTVMEQVRSGGKVQALVSTSVEAQSACEKGEVSKVESKFSWNEAEAQGRDIKILGLKSLEIPENSEPKSFSSLTIFVRAKVSGAWSCAWMTNSFSDDEKYTYYDLFRQSPSRSLQSLTQSDTVIFDGISTRAEHTLIIDPANNEIRFKGSKEISRFQSAYQRARKNLKIKFGLALHTNHCGDSVQSGTFKSTPVRATTRDGFIVVPLSPFAEHIDFQPDHSLGFVYFPVATVGDWQCAYFDLNTDWGFDQKQLAAIKNFTDASPSTDPLINEELLGLLDSLKNGNPSVVDQDGKAPTITIASASSDGPRGIISGVVTDRSGVAEITMNDNKIVFDADGGFSYATYVPHEGLDITIRAVDFKGLSTTETIRLERTKRIQKASHLDAVNPLAGPNQERSRNRVALIIGLEKYAVSQPAEFASRDAEVFADYAREKLGVPAGNVKLLTDSRASERGILRALKVWLPTVVRPDETDLYVFYAGHGMPTADGSSAYLVPHDGDVQLLEDTAISRTRFFNEIEKARPRSATFFFDNCYSGATRSEELLLASRPIGIKVQETDVPDNYLVFTAGESNQTAGVLNEVKHGRFSYFVFKGLEGEADANSDGKISAGELHTYVKESVGRFSAGAQTPTMLGDSSRWVLR